MIQLKAALNPVRYPLRYMMFQGCSIKYQVKLFVLPALCSLLTTNRYKSVFAHPHAGVFARRGYNVQSLAVGACEREGCSRIITVVPGDLEGTSKLIKQLYKLVHVEKVCPLLLTLKPIQSSIASHSHSRNAATGV